MDSTFVMNIASTANHISTGVLSAVVIILTIIVSTKPLRNKIVALLKQMFAEDSTAEKLDKLTKLATETQELQRSNTISLELLKHASIDSLKHTLTEIYYDALDKGSISRYNLTSFVAMYETYKALGGNSYVHELYEQILKMQVSN